MTPGPSPGALRRLIEWPRRHVGAVLPILVLLAAAGAAFALRISPDRLLLSARPALGARAELPGIDAATVEAAVTLPLEQALAELPGLRGIESRSREGRAHVVIRFASPVDRDRALDEARRRVAHSRPYLPPAMEPPVVASSEAGWPAAVYAITAETLSEEIVRWAQNIFVDPLEELPEVAAATLEGLDEREILIQPEPRRLAGLGLTFDDLIAALRGDDAAPPPRSARRLIVTPGSAEAIGARAVRSPSGEPTALAEVARIYRVARPGAERLRYGDAPALRLTVYARSPAGAPHVAERAAAHLAWLQANEVVPANAAVRALHDESRATKAWLKHVLQRAGVGIVLVLLVVLVLFGARLGAAAALAFMVWLPVSVALTWSLGLSLNSATVAGLILACAPFALMAVLPFPAAVILAAVVAGMAVAAAEVFGVPAPASAVLAAAALGGILIRWLMTPWLHPRAGATAPLARLLPERWRVIPAPVAAAVTAAAVSIVVITSVYTLPAAEASEAGGAFTLRVYGGNPQQLVATSGSLLPGLYAIPGVEGVASSFAAQETWRLRLDPERIEQHGIALAEVGRAFAVARDGLVVGEIVNAEQRLPLRLQLAPGAAGESFERLLLRGEREDQPVLYLRDVGGAERVMQPSERLRVNGKPAVEVTGRWRGPGARGALERFCARVVVPEGYEFDCNIIDSPVYRENV